MPSSASMSKALVFESTAWLTLDVSWKLVLTLLVLVAASLKFVHGSLAASKNVRKSLPPGPTGLWLLGCTKQMLDPSIQPWFRFQAWSNEHNAREWRSGPCIYDSLANTGSHAAHLLSVPTLGQLTIIIK